MLENEGLKTDRLPLVPSTGHFVKDGIAFDFEGKPVGRVDPEAEGGLPIMLWSEFAKIKFPESRWLIKNLVPAGGFLILAAPSGEKKTWIALAMANSIATGDSSPT